MVSQAARLSMLSGSGSIEAHPGLLYRVPGFGEGSEHAAGHRLQPPAVGFATGAAEVVFHGCQVDAVERPSL